MDPKSEHRFFLVSTWGLHDLKVGIPLNVKMNHIQNFHKCNYLKQQKFGSHLFCTHGMQNFLYNSKWRKRTQNYATMSFSLNLSSLCEFHFTHCLFLTTKCFIQIYIYFVFKLSFFFSGSTPTSILFSYHTNHICIHYL